MPGGFQLLLGLPLQFCLGLPEALQSALRAGQFSGQRIGRLALAPTLVLLLIGMLRLGKQPSHGFFPVLLPLRQSLVGYGATGAGISHDLGAVDGYVAELHQSRFLAQPQRLYEQAGKRVQVLPPKGGDGIVIGVLVGGQIAECHIVMGGAFDPAGTGHPDAIAIEQQARQ